MKIQGISPVEQELIRFFIAGRVYQKDTGKPALMPICVVDHAWHLLLNDEVRYANLTSSYLEASIEHLPIKGYGEINWVTNYEFMFGQLSKEWFTSVNGTLNEIAYGEYLKKGKLYAAWECSPGYKPNEKQKPSQVEKVESK